MAELFSGRHYAEVFLFLERLQRAFVERRSHDGLEEYVNKFFGEFLRYPSVKADYAAEGRYRVAGKGEFIGLRQPLL